MNNQRPVMLMPALVSGGLAGLLSGIPFVNCLCCLWIIGGGILAAYLLSKDSPATLGASDGVIVGIFTGIIAAITDSLISLPFRGVSIEIFRKIMERIADFSEEIPYGWETWLERGTIGTSVSMFMLGFVISAFVFSALAALGGIIGISLFKKKETSTNQGALNVPKDTSNHKS